MRWSIWLLPLLYGILGHSSSCAWGFLHQSTRSQTQTKTRSRLIIPLQPSQRNTAPANCRRIPWALGMTGSTSGKVNNPPLVLDKNNNQDNNGGSTTSTRLVLPIFPLRKSVRLVSESLRLNLYEERFLTMSEYILYHNGNDNNTASSPTSSISTTTDHLKLFGALYASDKPQLVQKGVGPIVPMLEKGDIGVIFAVREWQEGMVPSMDGTLKRRRIRLDTIGISRFRIERIIHDGTVAVSSDENEHEHESNPPFILVEASVLMDDDEEALTKNTSNNNKSQEKTLRNAIQTKKKNLKGGGMAPEDDEKKDLSSPPSAEDKEMTTEALVQSLVEQFQQQQGIDGNSDNSEQREIFSFAAASALCPFGASPQERTALLKITSTQERLNRVVKQWS